MYQGRLQKIQIYRLWRILENYGSNHDLLQRMQKHCSGNHLLWLPHLSPSFPLFLAIHDLLVHQDCPQVHLILNSFSASSAVHHGDLSSTSAASTVQHVMVVLTLISFHRSIEPFENRKLSARITSGAYVKLRSSFAERCSKQNPSLR